MTALPRIVRLGTRASALARWQTDHVQSLLAEAWPGLTFEVQTISTRGDKVLNAPLPVVGGKGLFTAELESALRLGEIDLAVHSLKDLPTESPDGLIIGAVPRRANPQDVLISRNRYTFENLPAGAAVGTSSTRRAAQLLHRHPGAKILDIRGNVDTRVHKALDPAGPYDGIFLARAGLERLGLSDVPIQVLTVDEMLPAPGQGALAVQCRDEADLRDLLKPLIDMETWLAVTAERSFLAALGGGCAVPVAAFSSVHEKPDLRLQGRIFSPDGKQQIEVTAAKSVGTDIAAAQALGYELAQTALAQGAAALLGQNEGAGGNQA